MKTNQKTSFIVSFVVKNETKKLSVFKLQYNKRGDDTIALEKLLALNPTTQDFSKLAPAGLKVLESLNPDKDSNIQISAVEYTEQVDTSKSPYVRTFDTASVKVLETVQLSLKELKALANINIVVLKAREKKEKTEDNTSVPAIESLLE